MGEVAEQVGQFVTAFSSDLKDESLDGQRVVIGGIVTGFRRIITKANATMGVATLEDLQGTIEVVVFPKMYEQTAATWTEGTILLVAGRIDHRGDDVSLLADLAVDWDGAVSRGPEAFAREVAAGDRGRGGRRGGGPPTGGNGSGWVAGRVAPAGVPIERGEPVPVMAADASDAIREPVAVGPGAGSASAVFGEATPPSGLDEIRPGVPRVSPLRAEAQVAEELPRIAPAEPISTDTEPADMSSTSGPVMTEADDEPALPDEARAKAALASQAPTPQVESQSDQVLHVRFGGATSDRLVLAMETFKSLLRERPGATRVILHVPAPTGGGSLPMELSRRVAYDAELLSEVRRRLGDGLVDLSLA
jgi:hypothetical protein